MLSPRRRHGLLAADEQLPRPTFARIDTPGDTARLRFRPYELADVGEVERLFADDEARRFYPNMGRDGARQWIEWNLRNYGDAGVGLWALAERSSGRFVGDCGLTYQAVVDDRLLEIGYHVTAELRGRGYATEAALACRAYAFADLGAEVVCSIVDPRNDASIAVAQRIHDSSEEFTNDRGERMLLFLTRAP